MNWDRTRKVGGETSKTYQIKIDSGFLDKYLSGDNILEIGHRGGTDVQTDLGIVPNATGVDIGFPGYDGIHLPFDDYSQDAVYSSHCLEHIDDYKNALREWFRVIKIYGYLIIAVPHYQLYEKKNTPPSRYNPDHKRFYHPGRLLNEIYESLPKGEWRLRQCEDHDIGFDYSIPANVHSVGTYEIECVIQKLPHYDYIDSM